MTEMAPPGPPMTLLPSPFTPQQTAAFEAFGEAWEEFKLVERLSGEAHLVETFRTQATANMQAAAIALGAIFSLPAWARAAAGYAVTCLDESAEEIWKHDGLPLKWTMDLRRASGLLRDLLDLQPHQLGGSDLPSQVDEGGVSRPLGSSPVPTPDPAVLRQVAGEPRVSDLTDGQRRDMVARQVASSQRLAGVQTILEAVRTLLDDHVAMQEKAALWDALMGSARLRLLGWAEPTPTGYAHFGLEALTVYPGYDFTEGNRRAREVITAYARAALGLVGAAPATPAPARLPADLLRQLERRVWEMEHPSAVQVRARPDAMAHFDHDRVLLRAVLDAVQVGPR